MRDDFGDLFETDAPISPSGSKAVEAFCNNIGLTYRKERAVMDSAKPPFVLGADDFEDFVKNNFFHKQFTDGKSLLRFDKNKLYILEEDVNKLIKELINKFSMVAIHQRYLTLISDEMSVSFMLEGKIITNVNVMTENEDTANKVFDVVDKYHSDVRRLSFRWLLDVQGNTIDITEEWSESVTSNLYPYIKDFDTFADRFIASRSNILILQGPPGTGKTTFIKHLIDKLDRLAFLTYSEDVLNTDSAFADFLRYDWAGAFIVEDADLFLQSRADGNRMVSRFLNIGDGLIKLPKKKLIFSTNLPNLNDIDQALIRPGRCFDIVNFKALTKEQALVVAKERGFDLPVDKNEYTLGEIFNSPVSVDKGKSAFGFC